MCLYTNNKEGLVNTEPVTCYRVYRKGANGVFMSPFQGTRYNLKEGDEVVAQGETEFKRGSDFGGCFKLGIGFIHAVREKNIIFFLFLSMSEQIEQIVSEIFSMSKVRSTKRIDKCLLEILAYLRGLALCEMEIPAGERHWVEEYHTGKFSKSDICARRMIFKKEFQIDKKSEMLNIIWEVYSDSFGEKENNSIRNLIEKYREKGE